MLPSEQMEPTLRSEFDSDATLRSSAAIVSSPPTYMQLLTAGDDNGDEENMFPVSELSINLKSVSKPTPPTPNCCSRGLTKTSNNSMSAYQRELIQMMRDEHEEKMRVLHLKQYYYKLKIMELGGEQQ